MALHVFQGGAEHKVPVVISKIFKDQVGKMTRVPPIRCKAAVDGALAITHNICATLVKKYFFENIF